MKTALTAFTMITLGGAFLIGCKGPSGGPETPAGSPGTGTNVPRNNTPGLSGTGKMDPANLGTDARTRGGEPTTRPPTPQPLPRTTNPSTRPATNPSTR